MDKIRRICLYGAAGSGKSITAANVRSQMGFKGYNIELVEEVCKEWAYIPRNPESSDGFLLQASQIQKEDLRLRKDNVELIVTDSPIMLQYFYAWYHNVPLKSSMYLAAMEWEKRYPSLNIFLERRDEFYTRKGRYETLEEAKKIDTSLKLVLNTTKVVFRSFSCVDQECIINYIIEELEKNGKDEQ